jgi:hypothetical protein
MDDVRTSYEDLACSSRSCHNPLFGGTVKQRAHLTPNRGDARARIADGLPWFCTWNAGDRQSWIDGDSEW